MKSAAYFVTLQPKELECEPPTRRGRLQPSLRPYRCPPVSGRASAAPSAVRPCRGLRFHPDRRCSAAAAIYGIGIHEGWQQIGATTKLGPRRGETWAGKVGTAPFPHPVELLLLLQKLEMRGALRWLVPHSCVGRGMVIVRLQLRGEVPSHETQLNFRIFGNRPLCGDMGEQAALARAHKLHPVSPIAPSSTSSTSSGS